MARLEDLDLSERLFLNGYPFTVASRTMLSYRHEGDGQLWRF